MSMDTNKTNLATVLRVVEPVARPLPAAPAVEPVKDADVSSPAMARILALFDPGTFVEIGSEVRHRVHDYGMQDKRPAGDGVITGFGLIDGHRVFASSQDRTALGGALGEAHARKIMRMQDMALESRAALVMINDSGGARIQEGVDALAGYSAIFRRHVRASGKIPQIAVVCGPCAGGAAYGPALCDLTVMSSEGNMFLTGPRIIKAVCNEDVTVADLGGPDVHQTKTGLAHIVCKTDLEAVAAARNLLGYMQPTLRQAPNQHAADPSRHVPTDDRKVYDVRTVIHDIVDQGSFFELQKHFAHNVVIGFARMDGRSIGIVANNPRKLGGVLTAKAAAKAARFVRICDANHLPIVTLVDVPGFMPGIHQEHENVIGHGSKLLFAFAESGVTKISVILRKAFGGAYIAMSSRGLGAHVAYAWPDSQIAVLGDVGAMEILHRHEIAEAGADREALIAELRAQYKESMMTPQRAAEQGHIDAVIEPSRTRNMIIQSLAVIRGTTESHGIQQM
jgi:acetyl-CoA carboxylase carboxyltransferase component